MVGSFSSFGGFWSLEGCSFSSAGSSIEGFPSTGAGEGLGVGGGDGKGLAESGGD